MKAYIFIAALFVLAAATGCRKHADAPEAQAPKPADWTNKIDELKAHNQAKVTVTQGIWGTLTRKEGNCMPGADPKTTSCREYPIKETIRIYEYTRESDVTRDAERYITSINTKMLAITEADAEGFFQLYMATGKYSIINEYEGKLYCNITDNNGGLQPVTVGANAVSNLVTRVDEATY